MSLGSFTLSIHNGSAVWGEEDRGKRLSDVILKIIEHAKELEIGGCLILRLVVVTGDFVNETTEWNKQLDEVWRVSSEGAVGQTLTWGNGQPDSTYSIIILSQDIALGLVEGDTQLQALGTGIFIHELAHVHDNIRYLYNFGPEPVPKQGDWISYRQFIARSTWAEFFAEGYVYPYVKNYFFDENVSHAITLLQNAQRQIEQEILAFQSHQDVRKVWALAVDKLSSVFNQFGRSLSLLLSAQQDGEDNNQIEKFFEEVDDVSQAWRQVVQQLLDELIAANQKLEQDSFNRIGGIVDQGFRAMGLEPYR